MSRYSLNVFSLLFFMVMAYAKSVLTWGTLGVGLAIIVSLVYSRTASCKSGNTLGWVFESSCLINVSRTEKYRGRDAKSW